MPANTPVRNLPYPLPTEPLTDGANAIKNLALALDTLVMGPRTYRKTTPKAVNTTVAATDLLNGEITIGAGVIAAANGVLRLTAWGDWLQNSGAAQLTPKFQFVLGGTVILDTAAPTMGVNSDGTRRHWHLLAELVNLNAANVQTVAMRGWIRTPALGGAASSSFFATGDGLIHQAAPGQIGTDFFGAAEAAIDTTAAKLLELRCVNASASATYETKLQAALVEVV